MAHDQHLLWTTKGQKTAAKEPLHPHSLYDFFSTSNAARIRQGRPVQCVKSAAPRISGNNPDADVVRILFESHASLRNPSPTPATSRPMSSRSGRSSVSLGSKQKTKQASMSPTSLYLGLHKARCKSAPPRPADYYLPQRPKTAKSRIGSAVSSSRNAPKRAWQNRTSSAKSQHSLLSREEVQKRHKERCKSAPLPYDFSSIEVVSSVPEHGSDFKRLKAFTRPLTCMPDVVQNVLSHNGLRHCCSAYQPRPKTAYSSKQQFWPVARPAVFHRGDVPKYLHFVKPAGFWIKGAEVHSRTTPADNQYFIDDNHDISATDFLLQGEYDGEETVLFEDQFVMPATPSEASISDTKELADSIVDELQPEVDLDASPTEDLADVYLGEGGEDEVEDNPNDHVTPDATPEQDQEDFPPDDHGETQEIEVIVTKVEQSPNQSPSPEDTEQEPDAEIPSNELESDLEVVVPEIPQWAAKEEVHLEEEEQNDRGSSEQDVVPQSDQQLEEPGEPVKEVEDEPPKEAVNEGSKVEELKPQMNQVKFADSLVLTSYKSPQPKKERKEQPKRPVSILKPAVTKTESPTPEQKVPKVSLPDPQKKVTPVVGRKVPENLPQVKPLLKSVQGVGGKTAEEKQEEKPLDNEIKVAEERTEESPKLEPDVLPKPEYIRAPGAYRMYDPKDLLDYHLEQKRKLRPVKKSLTSTKMPQFKLSSESSEVITTILDEQKRRKDGMKPWLQGRLALSKQTSRFELPMDVTLLEAMTPMEYLTKYCIISTRRKALYKHIFQKVDKDRDNVITFKEMDKGLREIHVDSINTEQVKKLIEMVEGNEKSTFSLAQFSAIAAFSERLLFAETQVTEKNSAYCSKEVIEEADFCGLKYKLSGFPVNPTVRKILEVL